MGGPQPTQTSTVQMSPEHRQLFGLAQPGIRQFAAHVPERYQGATVAGFTEPQMQGQQAALQAAGTQADVAGRAADTSNFYLGGDIWNPATNPNLRGAIDASIRPLTQAYQENVLPGIRNEAISGSGSIGANFGSSKEGISEGIASRGYEQAVGDTASKLAQNQYETNVRAQLQAMGLLPQTLAGQTAAAQTMSGVGDVRQQMAQRQLDEQVANFNYDQYAPFLQSREILGLIPGIPGGVATSTANNPASVTPQSVLGGAATGAALGMAIPGIGAPIGAGVGAGASLLPFLFR